MRRCLVLAMALWGAAALGQDLPDASLPDASVGEGGADHTSEENDPGGACLSAADCERGFTCRGGSCVPGGIRDATFGCGAAAGSGLVGSLLVAAALARGRRGRGA